MIIWSKKKSTEGENTLVCWGYKVDTILLLPDIVFPKNIKRFQIINSIEMA